MSRSYTGREMCAHEGCRETGLFEYGTRREQDEHRARLRKHPWRCIRHTKPEAVLSADNTLRKTVLESYETNFDIAGASMHRFWTAPENIAEKKHGNGFSYGPGFKAFAKDFPVGTRLIITARVELP